MKNKRFYLFLSIASLFLIIPSLLVFSQNYPSPTGFVNDFARIISSQDREWMENVAREIAEKSGVEIAVATIPSISPYSIEDYSIGLAERWAVGKAKEDTGLLFVLALEERKARIEVGYGLEGILPDGKVGAIMDRAMIPYLRENKFSAGLRAGFDSAAAVVAEEYGLQITGLPEADAINSEEGFHIPVQFIIFLLIFFFGGGRIFWPLLFLTRGRRGVFGGGFGSSSSRSSSRGFGGGSFGGFGGGGFGGGGASRGF